MIVFPLMLLGVEILGLTPFVEFRSGPMMYLANAALLQSVVLGVVIYLTLRESITDETGSIENPPAMPPSYVWRGALWSVLHMLLYLLCVMLTIWWNDVFRDHKDDWWNWGVPAAWTMLALGVAMSACRIVFTRKRFFKELYPQWPALLPAVVCVGLYACYLYYREEIWRYAYRPVMYLAMWIMMKVQGVSGLGIAADGLPILGNQHVRLKVTAYCDGLEAIAMFWLWWGAIAFYRRKEEGFFGGWFTRLFVGTIALWLLNTLRLDVLIWLGQWKGAWLSVRMVHSQWWAIGALCLSALVLLWLGRRPAECL